MHEKYPISQQPFFQDLNLEAPLRPEAKPNALKLLLLLTVTQEVTVASGYLFLRALQITLCKCHRARKNILTPKER